MTVELLEGRAAKAALRDPGFVQRWEALHRRCPWATTFQGPAFSTVWYDVYGSAFTPVLVVARTPEGPLTGLLALARSTADDSLCAAGSYHAEYQCWLADPGDNGTFAVQALDAVRRRYPGRSVELRYVPALAPLGWVTSPSLRRSVAVRPVSRPLIDLGDGSAAAEWLGRKKHRDRLRRLAGTGSIAFEVLPDEGALRRVIDRFLDLYDFRQGAVNGAPPSRRDPHHREFYLALMRVPGLLHVTVQRRGATLVSAHINVVNGRELALGLLAQAPADAEHSPGVFHIQQLARLAASEGFHALDLTPGADAYKDRFATRREVVHVLELRSPAQAFVRAVRSGMRRVVRRALARVGADPDRVRDSVARLRSAAAALASPGGAAAAMRETATELRGSSVIAHLVDVRRLAAGRGDIRVDSLADLLAYHPGALGRHPRREVLSQALARLGSGQHVTTRSEGGSLAFCAWVAVAGTRARGDLSALVPGFPDSVPFLHEIRFGSSSAGAAAVAALAGAVHAAAALAECPVVAVLARQNQRAVAEALGALGAAPWREGDPVAAVSPIRAPANADRGKPVPARQA